MSDCNPAPTGPDAHATTLTPPPDHPLSPPAIPQISPEFPIPEKSADQPSRLHTLLSQKQQAALNLLLAGNDDQFICQSLRIDRKTLYNWRRRHPAFIAEFNRRNAELWADVAADLRQGVADAVTALRDQLHRADPMTQLRAARALITLVNAPRLAPTEPTTVPAVLDRLLRAAAPPPAATPAPPITDAQRRALLDQLLAESAAAEAEDIAAHEARPDPTPTDPPQSETAPAHTG